MSKMIAIVSIISLLLITVQAFAEVDDNGYDNNYHQMVTDDSFELDPDMANNFLSKAPTTFTANVGQLENVNVRFYDQGGSLWFTDDGVWFELREYTNTLDQRSWVGDLDREFRPENEEWQPEIQEYKRVIIKQKFIGANNVTPIGMEQLSWKCNFFYGNNSDKWCTNVPNYGEIWYENLYDNIDLRYYTTKDGMKYNFIVHPGGNVEDICVQYKGSKVTSDGSNLFIRTPIGSIRDGELSVYQVINEKKTPIQAKLSVSNNFVRYLVDYDHRYTLVIDPLIYSTYLGGSLNDAEYARGIAVDDFKNAYVTGFTRATDFPTTPGAFDRSNNNQDVYVSKFNWNGSKLLFSTFVGGGGQEEAGGIAVDSLGNSYVTGETRSSGFPTTTGAYNENFNGFYDVFVLKLNSTGAGLIYSTYVGGSAGDSGNDIAIDKNGYAFVTGETRGTFPTSITAFDKTHDGNGDAFVFKINQNGSDLIYSTYISNGTEYGRGYGICIDSFGNAIITGNTRETNFHTTAGAYDTSINGGSDIFVSKFNNTGSKLLYSTFIGSSGDDTGLGIKVDNNNNT